MDNSNNTPIMLSTTQISIIPSPDDDDCPASTPLPIKRKLVTTTKSVTFPDLPELLQEIHVQPGINGYTDEEIALTWFSRTEMRSIRMECATILKQLEQAKHTTTNNNDPTSTTKVPHYYNHYYRGLEGRTMQGAQCKQANKLIGWDSVEMEQQRQRQAGARNEKNLARIYHDCTKHCMESALQYGLQDAKEAQQVYQEQEQEDNDTNDNNGQEHVNNEENQPPSTTTMPSSSSSSSSSSWQVVSSSLVWEKKTSKVQPSKRKLVSTPHRIVTSLTRSGPRCVAA